MPKTLNKNTNNAFSFNFDGRYFLCGCIWLALGASAFADDAFTSIALLVAGCVYTNKLFKKQEK